MRSAILYGLALLLLPAAQAQAPPDLKAVLKKVSEIYKAATQYEFIGDETCRGDQAGTSKPYHILFAFKAPNKYRVQWGAPCLKPGEQDEALIVLDGSLLWTYFPQVNRYDFIPASAIPPNPAGGPSGLSPDAVDHETMSAYRDAADSSTDFIREETGRYVVRVTPKDHSPAQTWWIDTATYHVVRIDDDESSVVFTTIKVNEPLPDDLFKFTPPPDAQKIRPDQ